MAANFDLILSVLREKVNLGLLDKMQRLHYGAITHPNAMNTSS